MAVSGVAIVWSGLLVGRVVSYWVPRSYKLVLMTGGDTPVTGSCPRDARVSASEHVPDIVEDC